MQHNLQATTKAGFERFYLSVPLSSFLRQLHSDPKDICSAENGESDFKSKVEKMAKILHGKQALPTDETQWLPCADPRSGVWSAKTNSRCVAERARNQLGWQPKFKLTDEEFEKDVLFTLPVIQGYLASQA